MTHGTLAQNRGVASLVTTVALVLIASIGIFYLSRNVITETRIIGNSLASQRALLNAEHVLTSEFQAYLNSNQTLTAYFTNRPNIRVCAADPSPPAHPNRTIFHTTNAAVCPPPVNGSRALLVARGTDPSGQAERYVSMVILPAGGGAARTLAPMVIQGATGTFAGNATIYNNDSNFTIWSGRRLTEITGSFETRIQINGINDQKSSEKTGNDYNIGPDVVLNDYNLRNLNADGLDRLALNSTRAEFRASAEMTIDLKTETLSKLTSANPQPKTVYIFNSTPGATVNVTINTSLGTLSQPIILAVDGNVNFTGNPTVYGRVYATGNIDFQGSGTVYGSIIANSTTGGSSGSGNFTIRANSTVTTRVDETLNPPRFMRSSWRDW